MSYDFDGTDDYIEAASAVVTAVPLTMACWFNPDNVTATVIAMSVSANTGSESQRLQLAGAVAGDRVRAQTSGGGSIAQASSASGYSASTWQHAAAIFSADNNRRAYLNGVGGTANTTNISPAGMNQTNIGCVWASGARVGFMAGLIAEAAIWAAALSDDEIASLATGIRPSLIRPQSLVFYAPLVREVIDHRDGISLSVSGAVVADHTRRIG